MSSQELVPVVYKGTILKSSFRYDILVEDCIVIELKAVAAILSVHEAQTMTYARLLEIPKSILLNFTCTNIFKEGQKTFVNDIYAMLPDK